MIKPFTFIALVGESLLSDTIEITLQVDPGIKIVRLPANLGPHDRRGPLAPDVIIADLNAVELPQLIAYLVKFPDTPLLGIEATTDRVIALSCREHAVHSAEDLSRVVHHAVGARNLIATTLPIGDTIDNAYPKLETTRPN